MSLYLSTGLLQGAGKGSPTQAASDREGQVLQQKGREKNQGSGRGLCTDGMRTVYRLMLHCGRECMDCIPSTDQCILIADNLVFGMALMHSGPVLRIGSSLE